MKTVTNCGCGAPFADHGPPASCSTSLVTVQHVSCDGRDYWCLRKKSDGRCIGDDRMEPEDAILVRDMCWVVTLAHECEYVSAEAAALRAEVAALKAAAAMTPTEVTDVVMFAFEALKRENAALKAENQRMVAVITEGTAENARLSNERNSLRRECQSRHVANTAMSADLTNAQAALSNAKADRDEQYEAIAALKAERDALRKQKDAAYGERNQCVSALGRMALALGHEVAVIQHKDKPGEEWEDDWRNILLINLPNGQVTWHFHDSESYLLLGLPVGGALEWDGHLTDEKYRRLARYEPGTTLANHKAALEHAIGWIPSRPDSVDHAERIEKMVRSIASGALNHDGSAKVKP